ncbi:hypothetical protein HDU91_006642 [Kappamyces sp. JEL0680]|nr:hypothetical protein HDU91_006642 [Kappamyces sp. JEL0680]
MEQVLGLHGPDSLPVTYALAQEFGVVDDWFASVPGPTYPNRHFLHCATAKGKTGNSLNVLGQSGVNVFKGLDCETTFSNMESSGKSWKVYADGITPSLLLYSDFRKPRNLAKIKPFHSFVQDAMQGTLPQYSYIDPNFLKADNHPPHNLGNGEAFVKLVYETLRSSPLWENSLLVVTYDEHGGFYDHVPPPVDVPIPDNAPVDPPVGDFKFDRLGVRVPTLLISPWIPKGQVFRSGHHGRYFEHSSISATLKRMFGLAKYLTRRDQWAVSLHSVANYLAEPRRDCVESVSI